MIFLGSIFRLFRSSDLRDRAILDWQTLYAILGDCGLRALTESLMVDKKFKIYEWKVCFLKGIRGYPQSYLSLIW